MGHSFKQLPDAYDDDMQTRMKKLRNGQEYIRMLEQRRCWAADQTGEWLTRLAMQQTSDAQGKNPPSDAQGGGGGGYHPPPLDFGLPVGIFRKYHAWVCFRGQGIQR